MKVKGGRVHYGKVLGVITLDTIFPRIPGDVGNAITFDFPVGFKKVGGATGKRVVAEADPTLLENFIAAAQELEREGVMAITTSCGFLAMWQKELSNAVNIPVLTSSLMLVPLVSRMIGKKKVGIITADASSLKEKHLKGAGIDSVPLAIAGMENEEEFRRVLRGNKTTMDVDKMEREVVGVARRLVSQNSDIGAIVLECANMPPYAYAVRKATGLPVFDILSLSEMVYHALFKKEFKREIW